MWDEKPVVIEYGAQIMVSEKPLKKTKENSAFTCIQVFIFPDWCWMPAAAYSTCRDVGECFFLHCSTDMTLIRRWTWTLEEVGMRTTSISHLCAPGLVTVNSGRGCWFVGFGKLQKWVAQTPTVQPSERSLSLPSDWLCEQQLWQSKLYIGFNLQPAADPRPNSLRRHINQHWNHILKEFDEIICVEETQRSLNAW